MSNLSSAPASNGKVALITGVTGQDGAYLAEILIAKGYVVHGIKRRSSSFNTGRIEHLYEDPHVQDARLVLHHGDLTDATNLIRIVQETAGRVTGTVFENGLATALRERFPSLLDRAV